MNTGLGKTVKIISKVIEIGSWIGAGITAALIATIAITGSLDKMKYFTDLEPETADITVSGFSIELLGKDGMPVFGAFIILFITMLGIMILTALTFRNVNKVFLLAEGSTPFQKAVVDRIKKIGYYIIAIPALNLVMSVIAGLSMGNQIEASVDFTYVLIGLIVLALSQFFAYGVTLEEDVDGLV